MREAFELAETDIPAIQALWRESGLPTRPEGRDGVEAMAAELRGGRATVLGMRDGGELVAVVLVTHDGRKGFINRMAVRPSHRRRGLARRLLARAEEHLGRLGLPLSSALVEEGNAASLALFREAGYTLRRDILYLRKPLGDERW